MKKKHVAGILALLLGIFGVHRYYLGQRLLGILYTFAFFFTLIISAEENVPAVMIPAILGFIDAVLLFVMPQEDFDDRYNKKRLQHTERRFAHQKVAPVHPPLAAARPVTSELQSLKKNAIELFRDYEFEEAAEIFLKALEVAPNDPSIHFNLACCYSMVEEAESAFSHLQKAVECGFDAAKKIHVHTALAFLRTHPDFDRFVENGFTIVKALPTPQANILDTTPVQEINEEDDLLTQISKLGDLLEKGVLTQEEFALQKQKLLEDF